MITSSSAFFIYNVILNSIFLHLVPILTILISMGIFVTEIKHAIKKRREMNVQGKQLKLLNIGTIIFIVQSASMTIRHSLMIASTFYIWYNDRINVFLRSTLDEQFSVNLLTTAVTISVSNILVIIFRKLYQ